MQSIGGADRHRRVHLADFDQRRAVVQVFVTVPFAGRDPPRGSRGRDVELGQFVVDHHVLELRLVRELVAETDAVVVDPEHHVEGTLELELLGQAHAQFVVVVAHEATLAPGLLPGLVEAARAAVGQHQVAVQLLGVAQQEAQPRGFDQWHALAAQAPQRAIFLETDFDPQDIARRGHRWPRSRALGARRRGCTGRGPAAIPVRCGSAWTDPRRTCRA